MACQFSGSISGYSGRWNWRKKFPTGYQIINADGTVQFTTIYPGSYDGRVIHIHVKVHTFDGSNETLEWTSQFYLNNYINERIHTQPPYSKHGPIDMTNEEDFIYKGPSSDGLVKANTGQRLMLKLNEDDKQGYIGTFNIGLNAK